MVVYSLENSESLKNDAMKWGVAIMVLTVSQGISSVHNIFYGQYCAMRARVAITDIVYRKVRTQTCLSKIIVFN